jgi:AraC-like DNA-binding protein
VNVKELATLVNMSVTTFHRQFKAVTGTTPLQYQKTLRLQEARRLMLRVMLDAGASLSAALTGRQAIISREIGGTFSHR